MNLRPYLEAVYARHTGELLQFSEFVALEEGKADAEAYDRFLRNVIRSHLESPHVLGLSAVLPICCWRVIPFLPCVLM